MPSLHSGPSSSIKQSSGDDMPISNETLKAIIRDFHGFDLSEAELEMIRPEIDNYLVAVESMDGLDLSNVMSSRLLKVAEGDTPDA